MTMRLLEYTAPPPYGVKITRNGYVNFETRTGFLENGYAAYQWVPDDETGQIPIRYLYDVHRRIEDYLNREDFREAVLEFIELYGCWFSADVTSKKYNLHNVDEWRSEWEHVQRVVEVLDMYVQHPYLTSGHTSSEEIERKLNQFTNITIESGRIAIRPMSIGGWVWALIASDYFDGVTYTPCPNPKCPREIPSTSPTTGRGVKYCSQSCKNAVHYLAGKRKKEKKNDMPSLAEMAKAFKEFNEQEKNN